MIFLRVIAVALFFTFQLAQASDQSVLIAVEDDAAPWTFPDGTGYINDLVVKAFSAAGVNVELRVMPYARCKDAAQRGKVVACFITSKTEETEKDFLFPNSPLIIPRNVIFVRKDNAIKGCDKKTWPTGFKVATVKGYEYVLALENLVKSGHIKPIETYSESRGLELLIGGKVEGAIVNVDEVKTVDYVGAFKKVKVELLMEGCDLGAMRGYLAFSKLDKRSASLIEKFDKGLVKFTDSGEMLKLQRFWRAKLAK